MAALYLLIHCSGFGIVPDNDCVEQLRVFSHPAFCEGNKQQSARCKLIGFVIVQA
jgi:hypothetical protein